MSFEKDMKKTTLYAHKKTSFMWHMFIMERIDQMENKQKPVERETRQLIQTYNVLLKSQIYAYFAKTQRDHFVGRAFKTLEKEKQNLYSSGSGNGSNK